METQSISLNVHPQILDLYEVLEKNGLHKQKEDVQSLVGYIESMEYNLSVMMNEIQEMHAEVNLLHDKGIRAKCAKIVTKAEDKILQVGTMVSVAKGKVVESAGAAVKAFKEKGKSALVQAVESMRIPAALSKIKSGFSHAAQSMRQYAGQIDVIRGELHEVGGHMKNAGRALAGKEALEAQELEADKGALARLRGLFTSCGKTFAQMERGAGRLAEKTGGEKSSVKTELRGLKPAPEGQRRQAASKEQAR